MSAEPALRLLPDSGEIPEDAPATYAEALVALDNLRHEIEGAVARGNRLAQENEHLTTALGKAHGQMQRLKSELNKDLRLHKDYAAVQRLWDGVWRPHHERAGEEIPDDWLKMALARLKDFDEAQLARALYGVIHNPQVNEKSGAVYDQWDNALRSTGHVNRHIAYADAYEGKQHRDRDRHPEVARALAAVGVPSLKDLENRCDRCGELMILHPRFASLKGADPCDDPDDFHFRADRWIRERERGR